MSRFSCVRFHLCWNIKLGSYESALSSITSWVMSWSEMPNQERRDLWTLGHSITCIWLNPFSGQWLVAGPGMVILVYIYIYIYMYSSLLQSCHGVCIELNPVSFFVCQQDASWGCWAGKCCYYCCLFCTLEQWLLHRIYSKQHTVLCSS